MRTLLEWLGYPTRESTQRDLTAWLLTVIGEPVLTRLVGFDTGTLVSSSLKTECSLVGAPKGRSRMRLDLYVESERAVVGIEMKVHSSAGLGQLEAYAEWLKGRAGQKKVVLVFLTETGTVPHYPDEFRGRIQPVELVCTTWDRLADLVPDGDPLGWKQAATRRAQEICDYEELLCSEKPLEAIEMDDSLANVHARGVLALANRVAAETGLSLVMGPHFGVYARDPHVDFPSARFKPPALAGPL
jgi:hypothetical protein